MEAILFVVFFIVETIIIQMTLKVRMISQIQKEFQRLNIRKVLIDCRYQLSFHTAFNGCLNILR